MQSLTRTPHKLRRHNVDGPAQQRQPRRAPRRQSTRAAAIRAAVREA